MEKRTDKNSYTLIFAIIMVLIVGSLLAYLASSLKPTITENQRLEKQQNILYAMGINNNDGTSANFVTTEEAPELFKKYIKQQLVVNSNGQATENNEAYLIDVKKEQAKAKAGETRQLPLFVGEDENGKKILYRSNSR